MWKKHLQTPICTFLRRALPPTSSCAAVNSISQTQYFSTLSSLRAFNTEERPRLSQIPRNQIFSNPGFYWKSFCSESPDEGICWNCKNRMTFMFCQSCRSVQPVDHSVDYFQIFGWERKYEIEDRNLEGKYKDWQKKLHPDLVHTKSEKEREYAAEQSARVIDAYLTLRDPLLRAIYIMRLDGVEVDEEKTISEPQLLAEIMEIREAVEEAGDAQALNQIQSQMQDKLRHWSNSFANAFQSKKYDEALTSIQRMTYYDRVTEEVVKKL